MFVPKQDLILLVFVEEKYANLPNVIAVLINFNSNSY